MKNVIFTLFSVFLITSSLSAEISEKEKEILKKEIKAELKEEMKEELKKSGDKLNKFLNMFTLHGKAKVRYEFDSRKLIDGSGSVERHRGVYMLKAGFIFRPHDYFRVGFGLGSGGETPNSANETMSDSFSSKPIYLDLAYIHIVPYFDWMNIYLGKFKNPVFTAGKTHMIWDSDVNPEGVAFDMSYKFGIVKLFFNTGIYVLDEFKAESDDPFLSVTQLGMNLKVAGFNMNLAVSYSDAFNMKKKLSYSKYVYEEDYDYSYSNTILADDTYAYDYNVITTDADFAYTFDKYFKLTLFGQFAANTASDVKDRFAYITGLKISSEKVKKLGDYEFNVRYRSAGKDAYIDAFSESSFYYGRTGAWGIDATAKAAIWNNVFLSITYFRQKLLVDNDLPDQALHMVQMDLVAKF